MFSPYDPAARGGHSLVLLMSVGPFGEVTTDSAVLMSGTGFPHDRSFILPPPPHKILFYLKRNQTLGTEATEPVRQAEARASSPLSAKAAGVTVSGLHGQPPVSTPEAGRLREPRFPQALKWVLFSLYDKGNMVLC